MSTLRIWSLFIRVPRIVAAVLLILSVAFLAKFDDTSHRPEVREGQFCSMFSRDEKDTFFTSSINMAPLTEV
jgi:hypothetical protein